MLEKLRSAPRFVQSVSHMLRLVWSASPLACVGTLIITAMQGLLPLATAWVIKLLLDGLTQRLAQNDTMLDGFLIGLLFLQAAIMLATALLPQVSRYLNAELSRQLTVHSGQQRRRRLRPRRGASPRCTGSRVLLLAPLTAPGG